MASSDLDRADTPDDFPRHEDDFSNDTRVVFSQTQRIWLLKEDLSDNFWSWSDSQKKWLAKRDDNTAALWRAAKAETQRSSPGSAAAATNANKRKADDRGNNGNQAKKKQKPSEPKENTAVWVENLPDNVTETELSETFSRYGILSQEIDSGRDRIKLYYDEQGKPTGDALIIYFRPESVKLAIQMLDDSDWHPGQPSRKGTITVKPADFSYKKHKAPQQAKAEGDAAAETDAKPKKQGMSRDQRKIIERTEQLNKRLADWSDDDDDPSSLPQTSSRHDKVVILKHMFTLAELAGDASAVIDITEDVREECEKHGAVTKVTVYDQEPDGVVSVRFAEAIAARAAVSALGGRKFAGATVEAGIASGREKFRKTTKADDDVQSSGARFEGFDDQIQE